jgi:hypothetical protein
VTRPGLYFFGKLGWNDLAERIISRNPAAPSNVLAVATPPISAPITPSIVASVPVKYRFLTGVLG